MRRRQIVAYRCNGTCLVNVDDQALTPDYSLTFRSHSPTGFEWGYGGSGPSQLALAILLEVTRAPAALRYYQDFKREFLTRMPHDAWAIEVRAIEDWLEAQEDARP